MSRHRRHGSGWTFNRSLNGAIKRAAWNASRPRRGGSGNNTNPKVGCGTLIVLVIILRIVFYFAGCS